MNNYQTEIDGLKEQVNVLQQRVKQLESAEALHRELENELMEKQNLLRTVLDVLPDTIYAKDLQLRKVVTNKAEVKMLGKQCEAEVIGKDDYQFYSEELARKFEQDDRMVIDSTTPLLSREESLIDGQGEQRWLLTSKLPWKNAHDEVIGLIGIGRDITERVKVEHSLKESLEMMRLIFDNSFDGISIYEETGNLQNRKLIDCNERYAQMAGRSRKELLEIGNPMPLVANLVSKKLYYLGTRDTLHGSFTWSRPDGKENIIEFSATSFDVNGKKITVGIDRDVTENHQRELEREKLIDELQTALADIKKLSGLVPICSNCKKIRDDNGFWNQLEQYIQERSEAKFSHGICPDCAKKLYPHVKFSN